MVIGPDTKIAALLKADPRALDAIVAITPKFEKLRNPLLRKLMAARTSIAMAARIGGCGVQAFYDQLEPLGFEADTSALPEEDSTHEVPAYLHQVAAKDIVTLDVRPVIEAGSDPLRQILSAVKEIPQGGALKIVNSFEPTPLIRLLEKQGFDYYVDEVQPGEIDTWFFRQDGSSAVVDIEKDTDSQGFEETLRKYEGFLIETDVRHLPMPQPMHTILEALETLAPGHALFVHHKRIPVFLLPELRDRDFDFRIKEVSDSEVKLLIFRAT